MAKYTNLLMVTKWNKYKNQYFQSRLVVVLWTIDREAIQSMMMVSDTMPHIYTWVQRNNKRRDFRKKASKSDHRAVGLETGLDTVWDAWCDVCGPASSSEVGEHASWWLFGVMGDGTCDDGQLPWELFASERGATCRWVPEGPAWSCCITDS